MKRSETENYITKNLKGYLTRKIIVVYKTRAELEVSSLYNESKHLMLVKLPMWYSESDVTSKLRGSSRRKNIITTALGQFMQ